MKVMKSKLVRRAVRRQIAPSDYAATFHAEGLADIEKFALAYHMDRVDCAMRVKRAV